LNDPVRVVVLASGGGSNFQSLLDRFREPSAPARVVGLVASRETAGALHRAERAGVPTAVIHARAPEDDASLLLETFDQWSGDLVVLAGYMQLIPERVVESYVGRLINIHPALLPAFGGQGMYGTRVHQAVLESGTRITGATVHFVDEAYDRGPIIAQWPVPVRSDDVVDTLSARVLETEHVLLPAVVDALASGRVWLDPDRRVRWTDEWFEADRFHVGGSGRFGLPDEHDRT